MLESFTSSCHEVGFCSVSFNSKEHLKLNQKITGITDWMVCPDDGDYNFDPPFRVILDDTRPLDTPQGQYISGASYRHGWKLNVLKAYCNKRFVCFVDPDFFIFTPIQQLIDRMKRDSLSFLGAPYYPIEGRKKIFDFPTAFCMIIDTAKIRLADLDFMPVGDLPGGMMGDTGYNIYKTYFNEPKYCAIPHYPKKLDFCKTTQKSLINLGIKPAYKIDEYFNDDGSIFGLHLHAKLHLRMDETTKKSRIFSHINEIKRIYDKVIQSRN